MTEPIAQLETITATTTTMSTTSPAKNIGTILLGLLAALAHAAIILVAGSMSYQSVIDKLTGEETTRKMAIEQLSQLEIARSEAVTQQLDHLERQVDDMLSYLRQGHK